MRYSPGMKAGERSRFVLGVVAGFALGNAAPAVAVPAIALLVAGCAASALRARRGAAQHGWEVFLRTAALWASVCLLVGWVSDWLPPSYPGEGAAAMTRSRPSCTVQISN